MLLHAHSGVRYLALLLGLLALVYAAWGVVGSRPYDQKMRRLAGFFAVTLQINILLGLTMIILGRGFYPQLGIHILLMVGAAVVAQIVPSVMRRRPIEERTWMPHLVSVAVALGLVVAGILTIPGASVFGTRG